MTTVDIKGAALLMNVHVRTAEKLVVRGILPAARIGHAYVLIEQDVLAYIKEQIASQTAQKRDKGGRQGKTKTAVAAGLEALG
jgi:excisionase family DNA binding protein